jgi:diphthamide biosynthesis protein 4
MNFYQILGISSNSTVDDIRQAYKRKLLQCHPDKNKANELSIDLIVEAWSTLKNEESRKIYDSSIAEKKYSQFGVFHESIDIDDLEFDEGENLFFESCRCGGLFLLPIDEVNENNMDDISVGCSSCSLFIRVIKSF